MTDTPGFAQIDGSGSDKPVSQYPPNKSNSAGFVMPYKVGSGSMRGTQIVGFGNVKIDGANNRIVLNNRSNFGFPTTIDARLGSLSDTAGDQSFGFKVTDANGTTLTLGILNDGTLGMEITDTDGFILFKLNGTTWYWYDKNYNTNIMQAGKLPDGNFGWATVPAGNNVADAFNTPT